MKLPQPLVAPAPSVHRAWPLWVALAALLLQLPLVLNPGYFSHDELQWAARATGGMLADWTAVDALQYRPLTFSLWLALSRAAFDAPYLFHLAVCALGSVNAMLLGGVLRRAGATAPQAAAGALAFLTNPYAMYAHGWVGTLGDLLWVAFALAAAWVVLARPRGASVMVAGLTALALLAKESALSLPALAVVGWMVDRGNRARWRNAAIVSALVVLGYLALRHRGLLATPAGGAYGWSPGNAPRNWLLYQLWPLMPTVFEVHTTLVAASRLAVGSAALGFAGLVAVAFRAGPATALALLAGGAAALGPVLVLNDPATQYGYALAAWSAAVFALAWPRLARPARLFVVAAALVTALHGANVARLIRHVGTLQATFSPALADALSRVPGSLRLVPEDRDQAWVYLRLTHEVPHYRGVPMLGRVQVVGEGETADFRITADGRLLPMR